MLYFNTNAGATLGSAILAANRSVVTRPKPARSTTISPSRSTGRHQRFWRQRTCDQQRDLAASVWLKWSEMDVGRGAGVTIQSYTGRIALGG